jgi:hypothetical protein
MAQVGALEQDPQTRSGCLGRSWLMLAAAIVVLGLAAVLTIILVFGGGDSGSGEDDGGGDGGGGVVQADQATLADWFGPDVARSVTESTDPDGGQSFSQADADGTVVPEAAISSTWSTVAAMDQMVLDAAFNDLSFPCGADTGEYVVTCPPGATRLDEGEYVLVGVELEGGVADGEGRFTYGLAFDDADDGDDFEGQPPFEADFFHSTESWYRLDVSAEGARSMWADGFVDGVPAVPRHSSALTVAQGNTLLWVIPADELPASPGDGLGYRATAFHDDGAFGEVPDPATSGGDISGSGVDEPLLAVDGEAIEVADVAALPAQVAGHEPRPEAEDDAEARHTELLLTDLEARLVDAVEAGDEEAILATVLPDVLVGPDGDACRAEALGTLGDAQAVRFTALPTGPDTSSGVAIYFPAAEIDGADGTMLWTPLAAPGSDGRLYVLLPSCLGLG